MHIHANVNIYIALAPSHVITSIHTHQNAHMHKCDMHALHAYILASMHICIRTYVRTCIHTYTRVCLHTYTNTHTYILHTNAHVHTYTQVFAQAFRPPYPATEPRTYVHTIRTDFQTYIAPRASHYMRACILVRPALAYAQQPCANAWSQATRVVTRICAVSFGRVTCQVVRQKRTDT